MRILEQIRGMFGNGKAPEERGAPRLLAYCSSNIGLGHYVRLLRVLEEVKRQVSGISILMATDARDHSMTQRLGIAVLQLPRFRFLDHERFKEQPELLNINARELQALRSGLLQSLGRSYRPHVLIMDSNPHGKRDEVLPLLRDLRGRRDCRKLLLMRDIPSPPGERFKLSGEMAEIRKHAALYDRLMFAGDARFFDAAQTYAWPEDVQSKMKYLGFVVPPVETRPRGEVFAPYPQLDPARPLAIVSFGGGWQAEQFAAQFIEGLRLRRELGGDKGLQMIMAVGPAVGAEHLRMLRERAEALGGIVVEHFTHHFAQVLQCADFAILQAGSATFQVLETDIPVLLTHRPYKSREQEERAERLARWPGIRLATCESLTAEECAEWLEWGLAQPRVRRATGFCYNGIENAAREVIDALRSVGGI